MLVCLPISNAVIRAGVRTILRHATTPGTGDPGCTTLEALTISMPAYRQFAVIQDGEVGGHRMRTDSSWAPQRNRAVLLLDDGDLGCFSWRCLFG